MYPFQKQLVSFDRRRADFQVIFLFTLEDVNLKVNARTPVFNLYVKMRYRGQQRVYHYRTFSFRMERLPLFREQASHMFRDDHIFACASKMCVVSYRFFNRIFKALENS